MLLRDNYSLGQLKRIFLDRLFRETGRNHDDRFEEEFGNRRAAWMANGQSLEDFHVETHMRHVMNSFGYLGDEREIEIHQAHLAEVRERNFSIDKRTKKLVEDQGKEDDFEETFDIRADILWVYRNFARVVTVNDTGDVFFDWSNAVGKAPTAGALMYMEWASRNREDFLTKIVPKILFSPKRALDQSRARDRQQDSRLAHVLEPPKLNPPRLDQQELVEDLEDCVVPPFVPDAPAPDERGKVDPDYDLEPISPQELRQIRKEAAAEQRAAAEQQERVDAEEWLRTRSQVPATEVVDTPLMEALKKFHEHD